MIRKKAVSPAEFEQLIAEAELAFALHYPCWQVRLELSVDQEDLEEVRFWQTNIWRRPGPPADRLVKVQHILYIPGRELVSKFDPPDDLFRKDKVITWAELELEERRARELAKDKGLVFYCEYFCSRKEKGEYMPITVVAGLK